MGHKIAPLSSALAFTLAELMIAITIFMGVVTIVAGVYVSSFRVDRKTAFQQQILEDARFLLKKIAQDIRENTIDYEEYYNTKVLLGNYGSNYGKYRALFYNPGEDAEGNTPGDLGMYCNTGVKWAPGTSCTILSGTEDQDTGQNPYVGNPDCADPDGASAFHNSGNLCAPIAPDPSPNLQNELYLISANGKTKKFFGREAIGRADPADKSTTVYALSMAEMTGTDTNNDNIPDTFACAQGYTCTGFVAPNFIPNSADLGFENIESDPDHHKDFIPISPLRISVDNVQFYISPLENPLLAYAEEDPAIQHVPYVTIFLTVSPNKAISGGKNVEDFKMTLQETVTTELLTPVPAPVFGQYP